MGTRQRILRAAGLGAMAVAGLAVRDLTQARHAILRNYPVIGHGRFLLERVGPELRQYIVTSNDEERPFSRDHRAWVYTSAKGLSNYTGFGTDNDIEHLAGYPIIKHRTFTGPGVEMGAHNEDEWALPSAKILGGPRGRKHAFRPGSVINISGMSFGALSAPAIQALNRGAAAAGALHNTGEGALSDHHLQGGDLIFQVGTSYFGCRDEQGRFSIDRLKDTLARGPVRALEVKLSQGAKPGLGGMLPAEKVSAEIAAIRGIPEGQNCASPSRHTEFGDVDSMLDFVELLAAETGLPVGIKSAVGNLEFWDQLVTLMSRGDRGVDFVNIDGGEGGTGAAPLLFADSVAYPFRIAFTEVYRRFAEAGLTDDVTFIGAGKLGIPENSVVAFALGVDLINVGREAMLALGCIQAQKCHTDRCPTGVATQDPRFARGLVVPDKAERVSRYLISLRRDLTKVSEAIGVPHPGLITPEDVDILDGQHTRMGVGDLYGYDQGYGVLGAHLADEIQRLVCAQP